MIKTIGELVFEVVDGLFARWMKREVIRIMCEEYSRVMGVWPTVEPDGELVDWIIGTVVGEVKSGELGEELGDFFVGVRVLVRRMLAQVRAPLN